MLLYLEYSLLLPVSYNYKNMKFIEEFKSFALKGNVVDMAVGIIIGGAFGTIVSSLVKDVIMPPIGVLLGGVDFSNLAWTLKEATEGSEAVVLGYGLFINNLISFIIVAFSVFMLVKAMNRIRDMYDEDAPEKPTEKECSHCISKISIKATKCKFCGSQI